MITFHPENQEVIPARKASALAAVVVVGAFLFAGVWLVETYVMPRRPAPSIEEVPLPAGMAVKGLSMPLGDCEASHPTGCSIAYSLHRDRDGAVGDLEREVGDQLSASGWIREDGKDRSWLDPGGAIRVRLRGGLVTVAWSDQIE